MFWSQKGYGVWTGGSYGDSDEFAWFDKGNRIIEKTVALKSAMGVSNPYFDPYSNNYWFTAEVFGLGHYKEIRPIDSVNQLAKIDMNAKSVTISHWPFYWTVPQLCIIPSDNIILVAANVDQRVKYGTAQYYASTLYWVRYPDFKPIASLKLPGFPEGMTYVHANNKVYIRTISLPEGRKTGVAIVDVKTRKLIQFMDIDCTEIRYVGHNRLAAIIYSGPVRAADKKQLLLIDTTTDKVVKTYDGIFDRIAHDAALERYERL